jgi:ketosteroid isomerase-like protein
MQQFARLREAWASDALREVTEPLAVGDRVVARMAWTGTGRGPGLNLELTFVWTVRQGLILEIEFLWDHAEALEAVGLRE